MATQDTRLAAVAGRHHAGVPPIDLILVVAGAVMAAILLFGLVVACGTFAVRWLGLPADLPEGAAYEPPVPASAGDPRACAATWQVAAGFGRRAHAVLHAARHSAELAEWVAEEKPAAAAAARAAAGLVAAAAEQARAAFIAGDASALAAAELAGATAAAQVTALTDGLPDWRIAERRKLYWLSLALIITAIFAAVVLWRH